MEEFDMVSRPIIDGGRRFRAFRLWDSDDRSLLDAISRGEFATAGFGNRDLRGLLCSRSKDVVAERRQSAKIGRQLRLLRAHGIVRKIQKTHRYQLTERSRLLTAAIHASREACLKDLLGKAA
jgi:hypothetical protein